MRKRIHSIRFNLAALMTVLLSFLTLGGSDAVAQGMEAMKGMASSRRVSAQVIDIVRDPAQVPPPVGNRPPTAVKVELTAVEAVGELDPTTGTTYRYWTFNGKVPAPMIRVRQGDMVQVTLHNNPSSHMVHSIDFHAAIGPGGGAALSQVLPGTEKTFTFQATTPGLFVYHCGTPMIADHIANGMYGLILVEPPGGLPRVDREYYVMQGEIYTTAPKGKTGLQSFSEAKLVQESPEYFVFNGAVDALTKKYPLHANTGETVRIFFGDAGPNKTSSLHVVGEIFNRDYQLGSLTSPPLNGIQTASVPPGGAAILELKAAMPGQFNFMDHAMARMARGLMGTLEVKGETTAQLMHAGPASAVADVRQSAVAGPTPMAGIIGKGDMDAAFPPTSGATSSNSENSHMRMMDMNHPANAAYKAAVPGSNVRDRAGRVQPPGAAQLDGCFTFAGPNGIPKLTLFHSQKSYELEPKSGLLRDSPLAFAQNANALVHITGHLDREPGYDGKHWFIVEAIDQLAPSCHTEQSVAQLRRAARRRLARANTAPAGAVTVGMGEMTFLQPDILVNVGQEVVWRNTSSTIHNVVADPAQATVVADVHLPRGARTFDSGYLQPGQTFVHTFTVPGVYRYVCTLHEASGMKGVVIVKAQGAKNMARVTEPNHE
jgi:nitrite reductase (NO-forming)